MTSRCDTARPQHDTGHVEPWFLSLLAEALPMMVRRSGAHGRCTYANRQWLLLTGRPLEEELGAGWANALHPDDRERCLESLRGACEAQQPLTLEYRLRCHDGAWHWLHEQAAPQDDGDGGFVHAAFDITERKAGERQLRQLLDRKQVWL